MDIFGHVQEGTQTAKIPIKVGFYIHQYHIYIYILYLNKYIYIYNYIYTLYLLYIYSVFIIYLYIYTHTFPLGPSNDTVILMASYGYVEGLEPHQSPVVAIKVSSIFPILVMCCRFLRLSSNLSSNFQGNQLQLICCLSSRAV